MVGALLALLVASASVANADDIFGWEPLFPDAERVEPPAAKKWKKMAKSPELHIRSGRERRVVRLGKSPRLPEREVAALARAAGFSDALVPVMVCIAKHESSLSPVAIGFNPQRNRKRGSSWDMGLWQINTINLRACGANDENIFYPPNNARCAYNVYRRQGLRAWMAFLANPQCASYRLASK